MKNQLIDLYKFQLKTDGSQRLYIPEGYVDLFWNWFREKATIKLGNKARVNLRPTSVPIIPDNFCFKNTYRISKAFVKRLYYYEGFSYKRATDKTLKHAFNICKHGMINDYSLHHKPDVKQDFYVGVYIPLTFARMVYKIKGDYKYSTDSLLVAYFMFKHEIEGFSNYTSP